MNAFETPHELEDEADRLRALFGETASRLRRNLNPATLFDEFTQSSGLRDVTPTKVFDFAAKRHPLITMAIGLGVGLLAYSAVRGAKSSERNIARENGSIRATLNSLAQSATNVFRERIDNKREALFNTAKAHVAASATQLSDAIERGLDDFVADIPVSAAVRPLIESTIQMILLAALEVMLPRTSR
jgi:hypothetical protein